jgi:tetratricopeptide (TPR) repeat protein
MFRKILTAVVVAVVFGAGPADAGENTPQVNKLLKKAYTLRDDKNYDAAIKVLDQVLAIDAGNADAWAEGAWIFNEQGKHDIAIKAANKALDAEDDHSNALREKGYALMKMGKTKEAAKCLYSAIESDKKNWTAYDYLAQALDTMGEKKLAKEVRSLKSAEQGE